MLGKLSLVSRSLSKWHVIKVPSPWNYAPLQALQNSGGRKEGRMRRVRCWNQSAVGFVKERKRLTSGGRAIFKAPCTDPHPSQRRLVGSNGPTARIKRPQGSKLPAAVHREY